MATKYTFSDKDASTVLDSIASRKKQAGSAPTKQRPKRFVNGKKYVPWDKLSSVVQHNIVDREKREKQNGLWWDEADHEPSVIELRAARAANPGYYQWTPKGWVEEEEEEDDMPKPMLKRSKSIRSATPVQIVDLETSESDEDDSDSESTVTLDLKQ